MEKPRTQSRFSRRGFVRTSAAGSVAGIVGLSSGSIVSASADPRGSVAVAATVVRASHSSETEGTIRLGVRLATRSNGIVTDGRVIVLDGIDFFASQDTIHQAIVERVRSDVARHLAERGQAVSPGEIAVRVFGGI